MGVVGMTRVLAIEGGPHGIRVNAIAPMARTRMTDGLLGDMHDWLDPELVAPVAAWLARERCSVTGEVFTVGGGRVGRVFVGVTPGFFKPGLAIEDVDAHLDEIRDEAGYLVPPPTAWASYRCWRSTSRSTRRPGPEAMTNAAARPTQWRTDTDRNCLGLAGTFAIASGASGRRRGRYPR
jgi:hypothetical protein